LRTLLDELGRVWSRWPLKISNRLKIFEKPSRPEIRLSAIVPKTGLSYCKHNNRTAILLRTFWDVMRSSRPNTDLTQSHNGLSASLLSVILIKSKQIVPSTFLHSPRCLQYVLGTLYWCSVRVVAFVSSLFNDNSVCSTIKSEGYKCGPSSYRII